MVSEREEQRRNRAESQADQTLNQRAEQRAQREYRQDAPSQRRVGQYVQPEPVPGDEDGGGAQVSEKMNEALAKGYFGTRIDETPRENYTVAGVTSGAPRPDAQEEKLSPDETPNADGGSQENQSAQ
jgi:hypothetical protein